jgi:hypothetical protein
MKERAPQAPYDHGVFDIVEEPIPAPGEALASTG